MADADEDVRADVARAEEDADFAAGFKDEPSSSKVAAKPEPEVKPEPKAEAKKEELQEPRKPEYVQLTKEQYDRLENAANRTASLEQQMSKAFGTIGNVQMVINKLQAETPRGLKVEIPKDAFAAMERDFPELAKHTREALEATLRGITGTGPANAEIDPDELRRLVGEHAAKDREERDKVRLTEEFDELQEVHPDWEKIIGRVDTAKQAPDPNNAFRKWLGTKDEAYQKKVNTTWSGAVISRAIERFHREVKVPAPKQTPPNLQQQLRASRIADAVTPRGDGGQAPPGRTDDDEFEAGYASR